MHRRRPKPRRALLIDALGTLVSLQPPVPRLVAALRERLGVRVSEQDAQRALTAEIVFYRDHMGGARDADSLRELRLRCASVLRAQLPREPAVDESSADDMLAVLLAALRFDAYADARPALARIRQADPALRIVVVSNWDVSLLQVLESTGLAPLLDAAVCSAAVGAPKPAPEMFGHALALAGVAARDAVHVGDSVEDDVAGAAACGITPVLIDRGRAAAPRAAATGPAGGRRARVIAGLHELDPTLQWQP